MEKMERHEGKASNATTPTLIMLSDGLERLPPGEGANIAPDRTDVREDQERMARLEGETSNALFETLEDWETQLKQADQELKRHKTDYRGPS